MEDITKLYDAIYHRKSVRSYAAEPLEAGTMFDLQRLVSEIEPLLPDIPFQIEVLTGEKPDGRFVVTAPHYLLFYSKADMPGAYENCGYILEQFSLEFACRGLGSCWLGGARPPKTLSAPDGLDYISMLAFGTPEGDWTRTDVSEFKRKPIDRITVVAEEADLLEAVRLAPSAINGQPWMITGAAGDLLFSRVKQSAVRRKMMAKMNRLDMGIALCHFRLAAAVAGRPVRISLDETQKHHDTVLAVPKGCIFSARVTYEPRER